jgi:hypothetical protein
LAVLVESQGLVGDLAQFRHHGAGALGQESQLGTGLLGSRAAVLAAADQEQCRVVLDPGRLDDHQPVLPDGPVHLGRLPPALRLEIDHEGGAAVARDGLDELPGISGVWFGDVIVQGGLFRQCRLGRTSAGCEGQPGKQNGSNRSHRVRAGLLGGGRAEDHLPARQGDDEITASCERVRHSLVPGKSGASVPGRRLSHRLFTAEAAPNEQDCVHWHRGAAAPFWERNKPQRASP